MRGRHIAIVAPSAVPYSIGGAEKLWWGLLEHINHETSHQAELIKLPSPESTFWEVIDSYRRFAELDLSHFDVVISTKYPSWMVQHPNHICYMQHRLRGLYDTYHLTRLPKKYGTKHPRIRALQDFMAEHRGRRDGLSGFFTTAERLRSTADLPEDALQFPGPLIREVVRFLDGVALSPVAIQRFCAISQNVADREDYFPQGRRVEVIHHPSDLRHFRTRSQEYLFTISRLDNAKRVHLLVEAMRHVRARIHLKIAGVGPESAALERMASDDPRVEFLGFVSDRRAEELYADALAVAYVPYDEDYGLVTIEAMMCAKPVLTCTDSGGPNGFVEDGKTGFSVPPDPERLAHAIDALCDRPAIAAEMGARGRERVQNITWQSTVGALLGDARPPQGRVRHRSPSRKITVATTFPIHPARGGGQVRIFNLYRELARSCAVELVTFAHPNEPGLDAALAPGLREIRTALSKEHLQAESRLSKSVGWTPITDVAMPRLYSLTPEYGAALRRSAAQADIIIASHPYLLPAIREVCGKRIFYEAHNVEVDLKKGILPPTPAGRQLLEWTRDVEAACCELADQVLACSQEDSARLAELYALPGDRITLVPNGVDVGEIPYVSAKDRHELKEGLGLSSSFTALFLGSWHGPNLQAVARILELGRSLPTVNFLIVGSVGHAFSGVQEPPNVGFMGVVDPETKGLVLATSDLALNPMESGTGTNLKMLEYFAAGIPVVSTPHGARGLRVRDDHHLTIAGIDSFGGAIEAARREAGQARAAARTLRARRLVEDVYSWRSIASAIRALV